MSTERREISSMRGLSRCRRAWRASPSGRGAAASRRQGRGVARPCRASSAGIRLCLQQPFSDFLLFLGEAQPPPPRADWVGRPLAGGNGTYETPEHSNALLTDADLDWQTPPTLWATPRASSAERNETTALGPIDDTNSDGSASAAANRPDLETWTPRLALPTCPAKTARLSAVFADESGIPQLSASWETANAWVRPMCSLNFVLRDLNGKGVHFAHLSIDSRRQPNLGA